MKTKNILKIGIFSIVVFALLISPILKSNSPQVRAASECEGARGYCKVPAPRIGCKEGYVKDSSQSCDPYEYKTECCAPDPDYGTITIRHGYKTINVRLPEERPEGLCKKNFNDGMQQCAERYGFLDPGKFGCEFKVVIADMWCVTTKAILEGLGKMFAGLINLEIGWILWALKPETFGGFTENEGVKQIWEMMRNLANALLILGMIGIAIATIIRYKKYVWQNTLWKLVIVALLVNFSLAIGGEIIDVSNYLSGHFLSIAQEENDSLAPRIQKSFGYKEEASGGTKTLIPPDIFGDEKYLLPKILDPEAAKRLEKIQQEQQVVGTLSTLEEITAAEITTAAEEVASYDLRFGNFFIIGFIMILVGGFAVISLLAVFVTILFRAFFLIVLLGLSPIVFAAWIFPDTEKYWKMWWEQFIKWCFFPVIFSFTLYIAVIAMSAMNEISIGAGSATQTIIQMVLFSMFLVGGLMFAIQGGGAISKTVMQQASKTGAAVGGFVGKKTKEAVTESPTYKKAGQALTHIPLLKGVGQEMMLAGEKGKMARVKGHEKNFENVGLSTLKQLEEAPLPSQLERQAYEQRIALTSKLAEMGQLGNNSIQFIKQNINDGRFDAKAITEALPHYFNIGEDKQLAETGDKISDKVKVLSRIKPDKLRDKTQTSDFVKNIMRDKKAIAAKEGKTEAEQNAIEQEAFEETIQEIAKTLSPAQLAGVWKGISPKDMVEGEWGGPMGKIVQAIEKDPEAKNKFYNEAIPTSQILREASGIKPKEKEKNDKKNEGPKETPPKPGWVKKSGIWTSPEE